MLKSLLAALLMVLTSIGVPAHAHEETYGQEYEYRILSESAGSFGLDVESFLSGVQALERAGFAVHSMGSTGRSLWAIMRKPK